MNTYIFYKPNGEIALTTMLSDSSEAAAVSDLPYITSESLVRPGDGYVVDGAFVAYDLTKKAAYASIPNIAATWDPVIGEWVDARAPAEVTAAAHAEIERDRENEIAADVTYDGSSFDADRVSQANIVTKIAELESAIALDVTIDSSLLFWRDATNTQHTFTTKTEMLDWLRGLVITISQRNSASYANSWARKNAL